MNIYDYIKSRYLRLSKGQRKVAQFVLEQPNVIVSNIASEVGRLAGVSESTVIRFCYALDLSGYGELQSKLNEYITLKEVVASPRVEKKASSDEVKNLMIEHAKQISDAIQKIDSKKIMCAIDVVAVSEKVSIITTKEHQKLAFHIRDGIEYAEVHFLEELNESFLQTLMKEHTLIIIQSNEPIFKPFVNVLLKEDNLNLIFVHNDKTHPLRKISTVDLFVKDPLFSKSFGVFSLVTSMSYMLKNKRMSMKSKEYSLT